MLRQKDYAQRVSALMQQRCKWKGQTEKKMKQYKRKEKLARSNRHDLNRNTALSRDTKERLAFFSYSLR